jgi:hypothetical protein
MQAGRGPFRSRGAQRQVAIARGRIEQRVSAEIDHNQVVYLRAHQAKFTQLALDLIACGVFTGQVDHVFRSPSPAFWIDEQPVQTFRVRLRKWQRCKVRRIQVLLYADNQGVVVFHVVPRSLFFVSLELYDTEPG